MVRWAVMALRSVLNWFWFWFEGEVVVVGELDVEDFKMRSGHV